MVAASARWLVGLVVAIAVGTNGCGQADHRASASSSPTSPTASVPAPPTFVDAALSPSGETDTIEVRSTATGAVLRSFAQGFLMAGNTLGRSGDGGVVVYLHYGGQGMAIVNTADGSSTDRPGGFDTALSADGRYIAWWDSNPAPPPGERQVAVLDRSTGLAHEVDVGALLGSQRTGVDGHGLAWLAGGHRLALVADHQAPTTEGGPVLPPNTSPPTTAPPAMPRLVVINLDAQDPAAHATVVDGPPDQAWRFVGAGATPGTVVVGDPMDAGATKKGRLWTIDVERASHSQRTLAVLPAATLPLDLDRSNSYLLYLSESDNALHHGVIRAGALVDDVVVPGRFSAAAW